jgi:hypothetical protein
MTKLDPVDVAIDMLKLELPAFETRFISGRDSIAIAGALPIGAGMSAEFVRYPLGRERAAFMVGEYDFKPAVPILESAGDRALRLAEERKVIEREVAPGVEMIVEVMRRFSIDAVNLRPTIDREVTVARERGRTEGYAEGRASGYAEGRRKMLQEIMDARENGDDDE